MLLNVTKKEINAILDAHHLLWIQTGGKEGSKADLSRANLLWTDLSIVWNKHCCHLSWLKDGTVCIRIGCECHPIPEWENIKEELADRHDRAWWNAEGQYVFEYLKGEAARYEAKKEDK